MHRSNERSEEVSHTIHTNNVGKKCMCAIELR